MIFQKKLIKRGGYRALKKNIVITIARQYGSGGRTVGEMLANDLGIHYYDHELIKLASEECHHSQFWQVNEKVESTTRIY